METRDAITTSEKRNENGNLVITARFWDGEKMRRASEQYTCNGTWNAHHRCATRLSLKFGRQLDGQSFVIGDNQFAWSLSQ